jgi:hypothetical protein
MRSRFSQFAYDVPLWLVYTVVLTIAVAPFVMNWADMIIPAFCLCIPVVLFGAHGMEMRDQDEDRA